MFTLKQYDTPLFSFEIEDDPLEGQRCRILHIEENTHPLRPIVREFAGER